jgi:hypothetical protein
LRSVQLCTPPNLHVTHHLVIICAHRENLPALLDAVCAELGANRPAVDPLRKGEFLVLHHADNKFAGLGSYRVDAAAPA